MNFWRGESNRALSSTQRWGQQWKSGGRGGVRDGGSRWGGGGWRGKGGPMQEVWIGQVEYNYLSGQSLMFLLPMIRDWNSTNRL